MAVEEVETGIYRVPSILGPRRFAQWLVVGDEGLLLVDSGIDGTIAEHVVPALAELGRRPEEITDVVITHADVDHYGGDSELRRVAPHARIRASADDRPWIESWEVIARERYGWYRRHGLDYDEATWSWLQDAAGPDTALDGTVADGEIIDLGGIEVEVVALPGHSPGHLGVLHRASATAIVMDAVLERGLYTVDNELISPPPYGSVPAYRGTVARLRELAPTRLGTSHYAPVEGRGGGRRLPRRNRRLRRRSRPVHRGGARARAEAARELLARRRRHPRPVPGDGGRAGALGGRAPGPGRRGGACPEGRRGRASGLGRSVIGRVVPHRSTAFA